MTGLKENHRYRLYGYRRIARYGFALPLFQPENFASNSLYTANTLISGDLGAPISDFEDTQIDPEVICDYDLIVQVGDVSPSIFCFDDQTFIGTLTEILIELKLMENTLLANSPLSFLDLCLYLYDKSSSSAYQASQSFLIEVYSESRSLSVIAESVLRKFVVLALCRTFSYKKSFVQLPMAVSEFRLLMRSEKSIEIVFPDDAFLELDDASWRLFHQSLGSYFSLIDVSFDVVREGRVQRSELSPGESRGLVLPKLGRYRTRRLGLAHEVAVDLGTTETRLFSSEGLVLSERSLVALKKTRAQGSKVIAFGDDAFMMDGRAPLGVEVVRPIREGAITDLELAAQMLRYFIRKVRKSPSLFRPLDLVLCVPTGSTSVERRALANAARGAGASRVSIVLQSMAAALGSGLSVAEPIAFLMLTIGGGISEAAIIALKGITYVSTIKMGGDRVTDEIISYFKRHHNLSIGNNTAENLKRKHGVACSRYANNNKYIRVRGMDLVFSVPKEILTSELELSHVIENSISAILEVTKSTIENAPPMISADIMQSGIVVAGGGASLRYIREYLEEELGLPVAIAEDPASSVARGINLAMRDTSYSSIFAAR